MGIFKNMGGNIPGGTFLGGNFPRGNLPGGKEFDLWKFFEKTPGGSFPDTEKNICEEFSSVHADLHQKSLHSPNP